MPTTRFAPSSLEAGEWIRHDAHTIPPPSLLPSFSLFASESITLFPLRNGQDSRKSIIESTSPPLPLPAMGLYVSPRLPRVLYDPAFPPIMCALCAWSLYLMRSLYRGNYAWIALAGLRMRVG